MSVTRAVVQRYTGVRAFSSSICAFNAKQKFSTPKEYVAKKQVERAQDQAFKESLLSGHQEYKPSIRTKDVVNPVTKRPVPLNVELLQYKPLRLKPTHGHKVVNIQFRGYDDDELLRAAEFASRAAYYLGIPCSAVKKLKTEKRLYTVIRSPFAQAKSKENFHRVTYNRHLEAFDANPEVVDLWLSYINKHAIEKVEYLAQIFTRESLDFAKNLDNLSAKDMKLPEAYNADMSDPIAKKVQELLNSESFKEHMDGAASKEKL